MIQDDTADQAWKSARPVIQANRNEEDTIVLSFSNSKFWVMEACLVKREEHMVRGGGGVFAIVLVKS